MHEQDSHSFGLGGLLGQSLEYLECPFLFTSEHGVVILKCASKNTSGNRDETKWHLRTEGWSAFVL